MSVMTHQQRSAKIDCASSGANALIAAAGAGKIIRVHRVFIKFASSVAFKFLSAATDLTGVMTGTEINLDMSSTDWPLFVTAANEAFNLNLGGAVQASGRIYYTIDG